MESNKILIPPHLNAEIYRTNTTGTGPGSSLDYIRIHADGSVLVGNSELTGRYWNGGVSIFKDIIEAQKHCHQAKKDIPLNSGTNDGCFIDSSSKILTCEDNGSLSIWSASPDDVWKTWNLDVTVAEHDDVVAAVDCINPGQEYVTAGADGNVKVWDINELICIRNYAGAHNMGITGVSVKPNSNTTFATSSLDRHLTLWAENVSKPVIDLVVNDCGVRCLQWLNEDKIVYGDEAGAVRVVDVRNRVPTPVAGECPAPVHKLAVDSRSDKVAVCCDNKIVSVWSLGKQEGSKLVYEDRLSHSNYVRGAVFDLNDQNLLYTVGWDGEIRIHTLLTKEISK